MRFGSSNFTITRNLARMRTGKLSQPLLLASVFVLSILLAAAYWQRRGTVLPPIFHEQAAVQKITVLQGHEFDITFNGRRIHAYLKVKTPPNAKEKVVLLLNKARKPQVIVYEKRESGWIVDLVFDYGGSNTSLTTWLRDNKLVWET